jgi:hypothetical protein
MEAFKITVLRRMHKGVITKSNVNAYSVYKSEDRSRCMEELESDEYVVKDIIYTESSKKPVTEYSITTKGRKWVKSNIRP